MPHRLRCSYNTGPRARVEQQKYRNCVHARPLVKRGETATTGQIHSNEQSKHRVVSGVVVVVVTAENSSSSRSNNQQPCRTIRACARKLSKTVCLCVYVSGPSLIVCDVTRCDHIIIIFQRFHTHTSRIGPNTRQTQNSSRHKHQVALCGVSKVMSEVCLRVRIARLCEACAHARACAYRELSQHNNGASRAT